MSVAETIPEKIRRLRAALEQARHDLIEAEAELADRLAEVYAFEFEFEAHVGNLVDRLSALEAEVSDYLERIKQMRAERTFGYGYRPVEEQFRRTWRPSPKAERKPPPQPTTPASEAQIKKLYRRLARHFHPDLAMDESDREYRTARMTAVNDAYAARSLVELMAIAAELEAKQPRRAEAPGRVDEQTGLEMAQALEDELVRCQRRLRQIDNELRNLHNRSMVELALEVKLARQEGRDLLAEMAADLEKKIARKTAERDMIKAQFDNLDYQGRVNRGQ